MQSKGKEKRGSSLTRALGSLNCASKPKQKDGAPIKTKKVLKEEEEARAAEKERIRQERLAEMAEIEKTVEHRYGMRINPHPAVALKAPPAPPPLSADDARKREESDQKMTQSIADGVDLDKYVDIVKCVSLFCEMGQEELRMAARALEVCTFRPGELVFDEGTEGREAWVLEEGTVISSVLCPGIAGAGWEWKETRPYKPGKMGSYFGERGLRRGEAREVRVVCLTSVKALRITQDSFIACMRMREYKENLLRGVQLFEQMTDDQIGKLAAIMELETYKAGETIYKAGEVGSQFFLIESGEASTSQPPAFFTSPRNYVAGESFGEKALLETSTTREATIAAVHAVSAYTLTRDSFEGQLGSLPRLQLEQLRMDPRTLIAQYYQPGDNRGPAGTLSSNGMQRRDDSVSHWFAVYRPCSRDSIAKMLGRVGVGKGLNIKGKSAQKNRLSGFVPFLQISNNDHKKDVERSPKDARTKIYFKNVMAREEAMQKLTQVMTQSAADLEIATAQIWPIRTYEPKAFGLDVPEPVVREAYIMRPDLSPVVGWETGRPSVPQFMDMNLHGVRGGSLPKVVLYQHDLSDPMNPHGLLIAYAEQDVKPVCSDFDTLTVGSKGMSYDPLPQDQINIVHWELDQTEHLLKHCAEDSSGWSKLWLGVIKAADEQGFHPEYPSKFGFGEATSTRLISDTVQATVSCGAVRHGAECFNFWFPQELDKDYLIVWDGFHGTNAADTPWTPDSPGSLPWKAAKEPELRQFLLERAREGYAFAINPVWPVRDPGWHDVLVALQRNEACKVQLDKWMPKSSGIIEKIEKLHSAYPNGFKPAPAGAGGGATRKRDGTQAKPPPPPTPAFNESLTT